MAVMFPKLLIPVCNLQFILLLAIAIIDFIKYKALNLIQIWLAGFIFIIWSEITQLIYTEYIDTYYFKAILFYLFANTFVLFGYYFTHTQIKPAKNSVEFYNYYRTFFPLLIFLLIFYILSGIQQAITNLTSTVTYGAGSSQGSGTLLNFFTTGLGFLLPSLIGYYYTYVKKNVFLAWILVLPIFIILLLAGSRFRLLFSALPFLIIIKWLPINNYSFKKIVPLMALGIGFLFLSDFIVDFRQNFSGLSISSEYDNQENDNPITLRIAEKMSNEGVVKMGMYANKYFEDNDLSLGRESSFLFIFWIPRGLWPSKPVMLDSWMIQNFEKVQEGFSSASGFMGELRADFGLFSLIFALIMGCLIKKTNNYVMSVFLDKGGNFDKILASISFPVLFFFIRSPITSLISIAMSVIIYFILKSIYTKPKYPLNFPNLIEEKNLNYANSSSN